MQFYRVWIRRVISGVAVSLLLCAIALSQSKRIKAKLPHSMSVQTTRCTLTLSQAPEIRGGIRLGTSMEEVASEFPSVRGEHGRSVNEFGEAFLLTLPVENNDKFAGIERFRISFIDNRVSFFSVDYSDYRPKNLNEFALQVSEKLGLPKAWTAPEKGMTLMTCNGFDVSVGYNIGAPSLTMFDLIASETVRKRKKEKEDAIRREEQERRRKEADRRRVFKP